MINRKIFKSVTVLFSLIIFSVNFLACSCQNDFLYDEKINEKQAEFAVNYIDVGHGDCFFVSFPDGKNLLIDNGEESKTNFAKIKAYLDGYGCDTIDYLILTHPDERHIGNTLSILENYSVGVCYIPYLVAPEFYPGYLKIVNKLKEKGVKTSVSQMGESFNGEDYFFCFLSPLEKDNLDSSYNSVNLIKDYTQRQLDDISPITYLQYKDTRFVFCSDAGISQEKIILDYHKLGIYKVAYNDKVDLDSVDYLCISSHGASSCSSQEFLNVLRPKNVIVSVGGNNVEFCPSTAVLERLEKANEDYNLFRTDVYGTVSVFVDEKGVDVTVAQRNK